MIIGAVGADAIDGLGGSDLICGLGGDDRLIGGRGVDSVDGGDGGDGDDSLIGDNFGATGAVNAAAGQDQLSGRAGNDTLVGGNSARQGAAADRPFGGPGDDSRGDTAPQVRMTISSAAVATAASSGTPWDSSVPRGPVMTYSWRGPGSWAT